MVLVAVGASSALVPRPAHASGDCTVTASMDAEERVFLRLINQYRGQNGLAPLGLSYTLSRASSWKSADMGTNVYFAHDDLSRNWYQRVLDCGYKFNTYAGENIAAGQVTGQQVFDAWRNSPGHNANMLGTAYNAIGIGRYYAPGSPYGWYWTTNFGGVDDGWASLSADAPPAPLDAPAATPATDPPMQHGWAMHRHHSRIAAAVFRRVN